MRALSTAVLIAITGLILALTLWPSLESAERLPVACFYCSERATADAIANVILFVPLGVALAWARPGTRAPWRLGLALSLGIELLQYLIPGRDPSIGDVVTNTVGTQVGWSLFGHVAAEMMRAPRPRTAYLATAGFASIVGVVVWMFGPAPTDAVYYGQWTPVLGHLEWYRGRVLAATVNHEAVTVGPLPHDGPIRQFVTGRGVLQVKGVAGSPVPRLAPLVSVYDQHQREILLLGPDRDALVLRYRHRAAAWRLDEPDLRLEGAFAGVARADTIALAAERASRTACLSLRGRSGCMAVATPGRGWSLVYYPESFPSWLRRALDALWVAGLTLPLGWYAGFRRTLVGCAAGTAGALIVLPLLGGIGPSPTAELLAAGLGLVTGAMVRRLSPTLP